MRIKRYLMFAAAITAAAISLLVPLASCASGGNDVGDIGANEDIIGGENNAGGADSDNTGVGGNNDNTDDGSVSGSTGSTGNAGSADGGQNGEEIAEEDMVIFVTAGSQTAELALADTVAATALFERLEEGDITYSADDYGGFEKVGELGFSLPSQDERITTAPGDVVLYQGDSIVIFYGSDSWAYTRIGSINLRGEELARFLAAGQGRVSITFSRK